MNVIQEKQDETERNLQILKNEIREVREAQEKDHEALASLQQMFSDSAWAVNNLKLAQDSIRHDCVLLKRTQEWHNDTILDLNGAVEQNEVRSLTNEISVNQVTAELTDIRHYIEEDRSSLRHLQAWFIQMNTTVYSNKASLNHVDTAFSSGQNSHHHSNRIPAVPNFDPTSIPDSSGAESARVDRVASSLEEEKNSLGHNLDELMEHKQKTQEKMHRYV